MLQLLSVKLNQLAGCMALYKNLFIYFDADWDYNSVLFRKKLMTLSTKNYFIFHCDISKDSEAESYLINIIKIDSLPTIITYDDKGHPNQIVYGIEKCKSFISNLLSFNYNLLSESIISPNKLISQLFTGDIGLLYISGDRSSVGKSTICLSILITLLRLGVSPQDIGYIKPVTQCEAEQPITRFCNRNQITCTSIGPVVFYKGFTRAFLSEDTETRKELLESVYEAVYKMKAAKQIVLVDGVGYPSVGSICGLSNADVARKLNSPVLLIGKSGVGDAVDSYNLNASYFEAHGVKVLGGIFNKLELDGFYNLHSCKEAVSLYFKKFKNHQKAYGFMPKLNISLSSQLDMEDGTCSETYTLMESISYSSNELELFEQFVQHVDIYEIIKDTWLQNVKLNYIYVYVIYIL